VINFKLKSSVIIYIILFFLVSSLSYPKEIVVSKNKILSSIKSAIEAADNGDTLIVLQGTYLESNIEVGKSITIIGKGNPVIDAQGKGKIFTVTVNDVSITGLTIKNSGISYLEDNAGIKLDGVSRCKILNNRFINNFFSIYIAKSFDCLIENNFIEGLKGRETNSGNGVHLWYCRDITIKNNNISNHRDGIYFEFVRNGRISNNVSKDNIRYGLHFMFSDSCEYRENTFQNNGAGVAVMYTKNVLMNNNTFKHNWGAASYGLLLKDISDSDIINNHFEENSVGIYIEGCSRIMATKNNFLKNGWAIKLMANSMSNIFNQNNFIANSFDVSTNSKQNFNTFESNYWYNYSGYDLDKDGIGDIPFRPVTMFSMMVESHSTSLILLNSIFIQILDIAERVIPALTPDALMDLKPRMKLIE
jgi:nitrous oxidase accessory protein